MSFGGVLMKIGIGICNYNRREDVCRAVASVVAQQLPLDALIVVDNASTDGSLEALKEMAIPRLEVVISLTNEGSAGGFSRVSELLLARGCDLILLMDSDCWLDANSLEGWIASMLDHPDVGVMGARIMHAQRPDAIQECGSFLDWGKAEFRLNRGDLIWEGLGSIPDIEEVDYVPACALMARREVFEKIGHFDPAWFIYFDDIEWCWKARTEGFAVRVNNRIAAFHKGGGKVKTSHFSTYYYWRNRMRFFGKYTDDARFPEMKAGFVETTCRAIATSRILGLDKSGRIISRAVEDGLSGACGEAAFDSGELGLDGPSLFLADERLRKGHQVLLKHVFDPIPESIGLKMPGYVTDRFGKCVSLETHFLLRPRYEELVAKLRLELGSRIDDGLEIMRRDNRNQQKTLG